tara:strand:+ start:3400 stop:4017 length:618 start_codon:yes stop_codon:yes gene_type:complete
MTFAEVYSKMSPFLIGTAMLAYGILLCHHANSLIRKKMKEKTDDVSGCDVSDDVLLEQGIAIILILLSIFVLNNALYAHFPAVYRKLTYLGDVHTKYGGHPFMKYIQMMIVLAFAIYFLVDIEKHKACVKNTGGVGGESLLFISTIIVIAVISLQLLYRGIQLIRRPRVTAYTKKERLALADQEYGGLFEHDNPKFSMRGRKRRG